ncbi:MAG: BON domain-containing protein [Thermoguttaceae bacterium]|jgi:hypothetical protein|nr:BON domain-containing protein [Thermoguttaceae bacterium]
MRRLFVGFLVAAAVALVPAWTYAGNQEVAEQIAASLKESGQLHGYKIGVKFQDGTAWLRGQVTSQEQMNTALRLAFQTPGVTRVVNNLTVVGQEADAAAKPAETVRPLQPVQGALAAEQTPRPFLRDMLSAQSNRMVGAEKASASPAAPVPSQRAERLAVTVGSNAPSPIARTGLEEPTLAPPRQNREPAVAPQPTLVVSPAVLPNVQPTMVAYNQPTPAAPAPTPAPVPVPPAPIPAGAAHSPGASGAPLPMAPAGGPLPMGSSAGPMRFDQPNMPNCAWPSYSAYPNYAALTYPKQHSAAAWPYIGPFYPYPQVPLGWRKVTLEWSDGWWFLDFDDGTAKGPFSGLFRPHR